MSRTPRADASARVATDATRVTAPRPHSLRPHWTQTARVTLYAFALAAAVAATALLFWPATDHGNRAVIDGGADTTRGDITARDVHEGDSQQGGSRDTLAALVVSGNVFSSTRRAPAGRFFTPGRSVGGGAVDESRAIGGDESSPTTTTADVNDVTTLPLLSGIIMHNGERQALLQLTATDDVPRLYREGDARSGFRIVRIGVDHVMIASRGATRKYRLASPPAPPTVSSPPAPL